MVDVLRKTRCIDGSEWKAIFPSLASLNSPIVFKGLIKHWPIVNSCWQSDEQLMDYLLSFYSGRPVVCYQAPGEKQGNIGYSDDLAQMAFSAKKTTLDQVFNEISQSKKKRTSAAVYVGSTTVDVCFPGLREANDLAFPDASPLVSIWMGNATKVPAHFDSPDNIACCVAGKRVFTLFPPEQLDNLYVGPLHFTPSGQSVSLVNFDNPDYEAHPKFHLALAQAEQAELEPGDALFLPSMWWHHVESKNDFNVLVNYWWRKDEPFMDAPLDALVHAILSLRDLSAKEKAAWKYIFDYYVFSEQTGKYNHIPEGAQGFLQPLDAQGARRLRSWLMNRLNK